MKMGSKSRPPITDVLHGLSSKSEKIRALARAGYLRTEIGKLLDIRYQHVRKALVDAGITEGLQRSAAFERSPVAVPIPPQPVEPMGGDILLRAGFRHLGDWLPRDGGQFELSTKAPPDAGVYVFVVDGWIKYIGLTQTGLRTRLSHYRQGHPQQRTSARVKALITGVLAEGKKVSVLIATPSEALAWKGLPINAAAGLEAGLIRMIRPEWNMLGAKKT
ncbi:MAG: GIY-YIG nuclease family protein [Alphaproteobacteria bacterium]